MSVILFEPTSIAAATAGMRTGADELRLLAAEVRRACECAMPPSIRGDVEKFMTTLDQILSMSADQLVDEATEVDRRSAQIQVDNLAAALTDAIVLHGGPQFTSATIGGVPDTTGWGTTTIGGVSDMTGWGSMTIGGVTTTSTSDVMDILGLGTATIGPANPGSFPLLEAAESLAARGNISGANQLIGVQGILNDSNNDMIGTWLTRSKAPGESLTDYKFDEPRGYEIRYGDD